LSSLPGNHIQIQVPFNPLHHEKLFLLCWALLAVTLSQAQFIHVHQISLLGTKPLMVASYYLLDGDTNHIANTIIDGDSITDPVNGSIVNFINFDWTDTGSIPPGPGTG
jgi:hypothetical protein